MPLQIRRGTELQRQDMTVPLAAGELLYVTDDQRLYIGNGTTLGGIQITGYTNEDAQDAAASMFTSGVHSGITFTYGTTQDTAGRIDATVDLSSYNGAISGDLVGSVFSDNSTLLIDGTNSKINLEGTIKGHVLPDSSETYDLGSGAYRFRDLWLSGSSIHLGNALITATGSAINLPAGSLVDGVPIGSGSGDGVIEGSNYKINIVGDDSTLIVNSATKQVTAAGGFIGNLTGNASTVTNGVYTTDVGTVTNTMLQNKSFLLGSTTITLGDTRPTISGLTSVTATTFFGNVTGNVSGNLTGNVAGDVIGDISGSVFADDSTLMVDSVDNVLSNGNITLSGSSITSLNDLSLRSVLTVGNHGLVVRNDNNAYPWNETRLILDAGGNPAPSTIISSRGSFETPSSISTGDTLYTQTWVSFDGTDFTPSAAMVLLSDVVATGDAPAKIYLVTTPNGDIINGKGITLTKGGVGIHTGIVDPVATLDINGFAKLAVLNAEPASPANGMIAIADGSGWDPLSNNKQSMVVRLGGAWVQLAAAA